MREYGVRTFDLVQNRLRLAALDCWRGEIALARIKERIFCRDFKV